MTTYVVTGRDRTGTSMMMRLLAMTSALTVARDLTYEAQVAANNAALGQPGYNANPNGYYAVGPLDTADQYPGQLVKIAVRNWRSTPVATNYTQTDYLVIEMTRDETTRQASLQRGFGYQDDPAMTLFSQQGSDQLHARPDCTVLTFDFATIVSSLTNALAAVAQIKAAGWPITIPNLATIGTLVDFNLYRNKF